MFINFLIEEQGQVFLGTLNVANLVMITFEKRDVEIVDGTTDSYYTLTLQFNAGLGEYTLFETDDLTRLQMVHSCFCSVLAGGDTVFPFNDVSFIEPCYPPESAPQNPIAPSINDDRRTLSDI